MFNPNFIFLIKLSCCLFMTGLIFFVQIVHYPLFNQIPKDALSNYAILHANQTSWVVIVPMIAELFTAILLCFNKPVWLSNQVAYLGLILVVIIFLSTFLVQVPLHHKIQTALSSDAINSLVITNWIRTIGWSTRSILLIFCLTYSFK